LKQWWILIFHSFRPKSEPTKLSILPNPSRGTPDRRKIVKAILAKKARELI
jgi:hypothetical protein